MIGGKSEIFFFFFFFFFGGGKGEKSHEETQKACNAQTSDIMGK